jgi:hypothetical protein
MKAVGGYVKSQFLENVKKAEKLITQRDQLFEII